MAKKDNLLFDPLHWIGWVITTVVIIGVFHLLDLHLHMGYNSIILLSVVVMVDIFKHKVGLQ